MSTPSPTPSPAASRVLCPHCASLDAPAGLALVDGEVHVSCARCAQTFSLGAMRGLRTALKLVPPQAPPPSPPPAPATGQRVTLPRGLTTVDLAAEPPPLLTARRVDPQEPFLVPSTHCPKCIGMRGPGPSCAQCGLVFAQVDLAQLQPPKWLQERWSLAWHDWSSPSLHRTMLERATQLSMLPALARLYRLRLTWAPGDAVAESARAEVMRRASVPLATVARIDVGGQRRRRMVLGAMALSITLVALAMWFTSSLR